MNKLLFLAGLLLGGTLGAGQIVVFGKEDVLTLDSGAAVAAPKDPAKARFLAACQAELAHPTASPTRFTLSAPPEWGKRVSGGGGVIEFRDAFPGGFFVRLTLTGLAPKHRYILTLNGNPALAGNDRLADPVPGNAKERYLDFLTVTTDGDGRYEATFGIALAAGPYHVRFYVKDTDDFKIVLFHDYFKFAVE